MKQFCFLLSFLCVLALTFSVATAQGGSGGGNPPQIPTFSTPLFTVVLDNNTAVPTDPFIINTNNPPLVNLMAMSIVVTTDSSDVQIKYLHLNISREQALVVSRLTTQPAIRSISLYDGGTNALLAQKEGNDYEYIFDGLNIVITKLSQKTLTLRFDEISGSGTIRPWVDQVQGVNKATSESYTCYDYVSGPRFNFVDPEGTDITYGRAPIDPGADTLFVYPGQHWYLYESYSTSPENWLAGVITAAELTVNNKFDPNQQNPEFYTQDAYIQNPWTTDTLGTPIFDRSSSNAVTFKWYSNYSSGVDNIQGFSRWGYNHQPVWTSQSLWSSANIVYYSPFFSDIRTKGFGSNVYLSCVDGIRCDIDGDGHVTKDDFNLMASGQLDDREMYHHNLIDFGRGLILFSWTTSIDTWLVNVWLHTPDDPLVKDLGIGELMSKKSTTPQPAAFNSSISGQTMTIATKGFAVAVSTILPNGEVWNQAARVVNGEATFTLPDKNLRYNVEAVSLSGQTTGVEEKTEIPVEFKLSQNYPNPFNPTTTISFSVPNSGPVTLKIYDLLGREVANLVDEEKPTGEYTANFNANKLASGIYIYRLTAGSFTSAKKMVLMK